MSYKFTHLLDHNASFFCYYSEFYNVSDDGMSTVCCLTTIPSNHPSLISPSFLSNSVDNKREQQNKIIDTEKKNYGIILNQPLQLMTYPKNLSISARFLQQPQQPLLLVAEEAEILDIDNQNDNDNLLLPRSTRSLKRRTSLFEKSRDWVNIFKATLFP